MQVRLFKDMQIFFAGAIFPPNLDFSDGICSQSCGGSHGQQARPPGRRETWRQVNRLLGEMGLGTDTPAGRRELAWQWLRKDPGVSPHFLHYFTQPRINKGT
jgi:hypothetical protein